MLKEWSEVIIETVAKLLSVRDLDVMVSHLSSLRKSLFQFFTVTYNSAKDLANGELLSHKVYADHVKYITDSFSSWARLYIGDCMSINRDNKTNQEKRMKKWNRVLQEHLHCWKFLYFFVSIKHRKIGLEFINQNWLINILWNL